MAFAAGVTAREMSTQVAVGKLLAIAEAVGFGSSCRTPVGTLAAVQRGLSFELGHSRKAAPQVAALGVLGWELVSSLAELVANLDPLAIPEDKYTEV